MRAPQNLTLSPTGGEGRVRGCVCKVSCSPHTHPSQRNAQSIRALQHPLTPTLSPVGGEGAV
jgi:hypothetical protein